MISQPRRTILILAGVALAVVIVAALVRPGGLLPSPSNVITTASLSPPAVTPTITEVASTTPTEVGLTRPTATSSPVVTIEPSPTFFDDPNLILTQFPVETETQMPVPLADIGDLVEVPVAQLRRIDAPDGVTILAEVANPTDSPVTDVRLVFTTVDGARVGETLPLRLTLLAGESRAGATAAIPANDAVIQRWSELEVHVVGAPPAVGPDQPGYPAQLTVGYATVKKEQSTLRFEATISNDTDRAADIRYQNIAFYGSDGTLLLVWDAGGHAPLAPGESYTLNGSIPLDQPVAEGFRLADTSDALVSVSAEIAL